MKDVYEHTERMRPESGPFTSSVSSDNDYSDYQPTVQMEGRGEDYRDSVGSGYMTDTRTLRLRREPPSFAWLVLVDGVHAGHIFTLGTDSTTIGRDSGCDVVIDDPAISRQHVKIRSVKVEDEKQSFILHDLATENGTHVNGEEKVKVELHDGDQILIGQTRLVFKRVEL